MGSKLKTIEFNTNHSAIKAKIEYMTVNHNPFILESGLLVFLYLKNNSATECIYTDNATFSLTAGDKTGNFIKEGFLSVPYTDSDKWHRIGVVFLNRFQHTINKVLGIVTGTSCSLNLKLIGKTTGVDFGVVFDKTIDLDSLYMKRLADNSLGRSEAHPSFFDTTLSSMILGETKSFKIKKNWKNVYQRIRYFWGDSLNDYNCFFTDSSCETKLQSNDGIVSGNDDTFIVGGSSEAGSESYYFNLLKGDVIYDELSRVNQVLCSNTAMCAIVLESYVGTNEYLGNRVLLVDVKLPEKYKPKVIPGDINVLNSNETIKTWDIALQGYSRAETFCSAVQAVMGDNAQIVKYEISILGGISTAAENITTDIFSTSGKKTFKYKATDSRGRTAESTNTLTVYPYFLPEVSFAELYRCDEKGVKADKGSWFWVKPLSYFASCNSKNKVIFTCRWKKVNETAFDENNQVTVSSSGTIINANLIDTSSYDVALGIEDSLSGYTESISPLTSGRVLMHFNVGGKSVGIGMYNYTDNSCKIGFDFLLGELGINEYIRAMVADSVIEKGLIEDGIGTWCKFKDGATDWTTTFTVVWYYEKYESGKVVLYGTAQIENIEPYGTGNNYTRIRFVTPTVNGKKLTLQNGHRYLEKSGSADCNTADSGVKTASWLIKNKNGMNSSENFEYMFYRPETWTAGEISPMLNIKIVAIPK